VGAESSSPPSPTMAGGASKRGSSARARAEACFICFEDFKREGMIPRRGHKEGFKHPLTGQPNRNLFRTRSRFKAKRTLFIFVSHRWLSPGRRGLDGHPDDKDGSKFKLIVEAVEKLLLSKPMIADDCQVALWIDFGCVDQDLENPAEELNELHEIIAQCDALLTPVHDPEHGDWQYPPLGWSDHYAEYEAEAFQEYWSRAWCAVEAMSAACMPVVPSASERGAVFREERPMWFAVMQGRRPHIVYGTKESSEMLPPKFFPPLLHSNLVEYDPAKMELTSEKDRGTIKKIAEGLRKHIKPLEEGWKGPRNGKGEPHGRGTYVYPNGDVCEGEFKDGNMHGVATYKFVAGAVYDGEYEEGKKKGTGTYKFASGNLYEGEWLDDKPHGRGTYRGADGEVYEGEWLNNAMHGIGTYEYASGDVYEGEWKHDKRNGRGKMMYADGRLEDGEWKDGEFLG
jgi:hypothetical protein